MPFIVYNSTEAVEDFRRYTHEVAEHFQSDKMAEDYLNGLIDWDGNPVCDIHGAKPCDCISMDC